MLGRRSSRSRIALLIQVLGDETDSKQGLLGLVQELHLPFGVLSKIGSEAANPVPANFGYFCPSSVAVGKLGAVIRTAAVLVATNYCGPLQPCSEDAIRCWVVSS